MEYRCQPMLMEEIKLLRNGELYADLTKHERPGAIPPDSACGEDVQTVMSLYTFAVNGDKVEARPLAKKLRIERMAMSEDPRQLARDCAHLISIYVYA